MKLRYLALIVITALGTSTAIAQSVPTTIVDDSFNIRTLNWRGGVGRTMVRWRAVIIDGNIAVCSAYATSGGRKYTSLSRQLVADLRIKRNDSVFLSSLRFSAIHGSRGFSENLIGFRANCRVTSTPGTSADLSAFRADLIRRFYRPR